MVREYDEAEVPAVYNLEDIPPYNIRQGLDLHIFRGLDLLLSTATIEPDAELETDPHSHPWEQVTFIVQGQVYYNVDGERFHVSEGDMFFIPPGAEHYAEQDPEADETLVNLDVFPMREDYVEHATYQREFYGDEDEEA